MTLAQIKAKHGATFSLGEGYAEARRDHASWWPVYKKNLSVAAKRFTAMEGHDRWYGEK